MAFESVRSYVQLASGLGEMTKARALEAAQGLLTLPGADEVTRRAVRASTLADQLLEAAKANRANLVALVQHEVETALRRADVARVADVRAAQVSLAALGKEIADLRGMLRAGGALVGRRSGAVSTTARTHGPAAEPAASASVSSIAPARQPLARSGRTPSAGTASKADTTTTTAAKKATAKKATAKKATAKKATAKKATAKKATGSTPAKRTGAAKGAAKKATSKEAAATRGSTTTTKAGS